MSSKRYNSFVSFLLFCTFLQRNIRNIDAEKQCLKPTFGKNEKIVIEYFYRYTDHKYPEMINDLCELIINSNGLMSIVYRMSSDLKDKANCIQSKNCSQSRLWACDYSYYEQIYNDCNESLPSFGGKVADCVCAGSADNILTANEAALVKYGITETPALVVNNKCDPCFTDYSAMFMKKYFCTASTDEFPFCKN